MLYNLSFPSRVDVNLQQVLIKCEGPCNSETNSRAVDIFQFWLLQGSRLTLSSNVFLSDFSTDVFPRFATGRAGWLSLCSGGHVPASPAKSVLAIGAQIQPTRPKITGEILLSEELIFSLIVCFYQKAGISAESVMGTCSSFPFLMTKMCYIHKRRMVPLPGLPALSSSEFLSITGRCVFFVLSCTCFFFYSFKIVPTPLPPNL